MRERTKERKKERRKEREKEREKELELQQRNHQPISLGPVALWQLNYKLRFNFHHFWMMKTF